MHEPTQDMIVSELRRRGIAYVTDMLSVFGPAYASILPYELQRMKATGLVLYEEPLGLHSVLRLPSTSWMQQP